MGVSSNLTDCCLLCTNRDLKASHYFEDNKNPPIKKIDSTEKDEINNNDKRENEGNSSDNSSNSNEYLTPGEMASINEKICNKLQKYEPIPSRSSDVNIIYRSGIIDSRIRNGDF